jgi:beta-lactamase class A
VDAHPLLTDLGLTGAGCAAPVTGGQAVGFDTDALVSPASVMKIQIALAVEIAIAKGLVDGTAPRVLSPERRTIGPTGMSLMRDELTMSVRDLVVALLTISDNVATDELIEVVGLDEINRLTRSLGLEHTSIAGNLRDALDQIAAEAGFADFASMLAHDPATTGPPSEEEVMARVRGSAPLDPARGTRTTAADAVRLLQEIWTDRAGPPEACASVRRLMAHQLARNRIASAFSPPVSVAAKSGALLGVVRNEAGVVTFPDGAAYAVAVFTRRETPARVDPAVVDATIGRIAGELIAQLRGS